jgi:hypothetical protein
MLRYLHGAADRVAFGVVIEVAAGLASVVVVDEVIGVGGQPIARGQEVTRREREWRDTQAGQRGEDVVARRLSTLGD